MHSHNQSLLAQLGFQDPDKGDLHDRALNYCTSLAFAQLVDRQAFQVKARTEEPLFMKGRAVGFADAILEIDSRRGLCARCNKYRTSGSFSILLEVKTAKPKSIGDWIRQINLYRTTQFHFAAICSQSVSDLQAIIAAPVRIEDYQLEMLKQSNIQFISLCGAPKVPSEICEDGCECLTW